jgi:transposase
MHHINISPNGGAFALFAPNQYPVQLSPEQRQSFEEITRNGYAPAKKIRHAQVLLLSDRNRPGGHRFDTDIAATLGMHINTVARVRKAFVTQGEQPALERKPRQTPPVPPKIDGHVEAHLVAICCSPPPEGRARWTLSLLVGELTGRKIVTSVCAETVRRALKKTNCSRGARSPGASPRKIEPGLLPRWRSCSTRTRPSTAPRNR